MIDIASALKLCRNKDYNRIVEDEKIKVRFIDLDSAYGTILIGNETFIFLNEEMDNKLTNYVMLHELGHYFLNGSGVYCFTEKENNTEIEADVFACLMLGETKQKWINEGCPSKIADGVHNYLTNYKI